MINSIEFYCGMSREMKAIKCSEMCVKTDDMIELIARLRQAEKDAARYRWLRESASTEDHGGLAYNFRLVDAIRYMPGPVPNETMDIDEAIDEAMQCK